MALKAPDKDPDEVLDYDVDFTAWVVAPATLQAVGSSAVLDGTSSPGGLSDLTIDTMVIASDIAVVWLSGGTAGETYTFKVTVVDDNSPVRTGVRRIKIKIKEK